jgi:hypothetical protein
LLPHHPAAPDQALDEPGGAAGLVSSVSASRSIDIRRSGAVASLKSAWCSTSVQPPAASIRAVIAAWTASTAW